MVFSSALFLFLFLPITLLGYYIMPGKGRNLWLLLASLVFYSWGEPKYVLLMLLSIGVNFVLGLGIEHYHQMEGKQGVRKGILLCSLVYNIGILFYFKYLGFTVHTIERILPIGTETVDSFVDTITMPIGISFFTFQIMSYVIDVYRKEVPAQKSILKLALYISMFPQLVAGPIVRYSLVAKQMEQRTISWDKLYVGIQRFMKGFTKKVLFSNTLAQIADMAFDQKLYVQSGAMAWFGIMAYTMQIYYDFSGYSDMAIGLGKLFGFDFNENFDHPYCAKSIQEFWRRWHISLSTWFRDYLYIPLGGSRCATWKIYRNTMIVFLVTGLWHGADFTFIIWGLYYGIFLIIERGGMAKVLQKLPPFLQHLYAVLLIMIGWVFFRADSLSAAISYLGGMLQLGNWNMELFLYATNRELQLFLLLGVIGCMPVKAILTKLVKQEPKKVGRIEIGETILRFAGFIISIIYMTGSGFNPFIYFRF